MIGPKVLVVTKQEFIKNPRPGMRPIAYKPQGNISVFFAQGPNKEMAKARLICALFYFFRAGHYLVRDPNNKLRTIFKGSIDKNKNKNALSVLHNERGYNLGRY